MKGKDWASPIGDGWTKIDAAAGAAWIRQWTHSTGVIRRDYGEYVQVIRPNGWRQYSGKGGGFLVFLPDGTVEIHWNPVGALASAFTGNRTYKVTKSAGKRATPQLEKTFAMVTQLRACFIIPDDHRPTDAPHGIPGLPPDEELSTDEEYLPDEESPRAAEILATFHREAYQIIESIVKGDAESIRRIAAAVEYHEGIRTGDLHVPIETHLDILAAIGEAATAEKGVPSRAAILKEFNALVQKNRRKDDIRDELAGMGFAWMRSI